MYSEPFTLPAGTVLNVVARYDNSTNNPSNPSYPPERVTFGEQTTDEMLYCFFLVAVDDPKLVPVVAGDSLTHEAIRRAAHRLKGGR